MSDTRSRHAFGVYPGIDMCWAHLLEGNREMHRIYGGYRIHALSVHPRVGMPNMSSLVPNPRSVSVHAVTLK